MRICPACYDRVPDFTAGVPCVGHNSFHVGSTKGMRNRGRLFQGLFAVLLPEATSIRMPVQGKNKANNGIMIFTMPLR